MRQEVLGSTAAARAPTIGTIGFIAAVAATRGRGGACLHLHAHRRRTAGTVGFGNRVGKGVGTGKSAGRCIRNHVAAVDDRAVLRGWIAHRGDNEAVTVAALIAP